MIQLYIFVKIGGISCIFIGVITIFQTMKFVNNGCLQGVGMMKEVAFCSIFAFSGVNLILVALLVLVFKCGIWGVWTSTLVSQTSQAVITGYYINETFCRDTWKSKNILRETITGAADDDYFHLLWKN